MLDAIDETIVDSRKKFLPFLSDGLNRLQKNKLANHLLLQMKDIGSPYGWGL